MLAFTGSPGSAQWQTPEEALALLDAKASANTDPAFAERTLDRILGALAETTEHLESYGEQLAAELLASHRRVRSASGEIVRGVQVRAQACPDVLGTYVYLPASGRAA